MRSIWLLAWNSVQSAIHSSITTTSLNYRHHQIILHSSRRRNGQWCAFLYESNRTIDCSLENWLTLPTYRQKLINFMYLPFTWNERPISFCGARFRQMNRCCKFAFLRFCINRRDIHFWMVRHCAFLGVRQFSQKQELNTHQSGLLIIQHIIHA